MARNVKISTHRTGQDFAIVAVIRDAKSGRRLAETQARPIGGEAMARGDAFSIATDRNWQPVGEGPDES